MKRGCGRLGRGTPACGRPQTSDRVTGLSLVPAAERFADGMRAVFRIAPPVVEGVVWEFIGEVEACELVHPQTRVERRPSVNSRHRDSHTEPDLEE
jgi:hypothetical protein